MCPYHFWNFALDGTLRNVPQADEFDPVALEDCGLVPASVGEWGGMVFVNGDARRRLHGVAAGLPRPHRELPARAAAARSCACSSTRAATGSCSSRTTSTCTTSGICTRARSSAYDHQQFEWDAIGPHWVSYEPAKAGVERKRPHVGSTPIAGLDERDRVGIGAHMLFPNTLFATESEFFMSYVAKPLAPDRCVIDVRIRAEPGADVEMLVAAAKEFMLEDVGACEGIQATVRSSRFRVGPLAQNHERPITLLPRAPAGARSSS